MIFILLAAFNEEQDLPALFNNLGAMKLEPYKIVLIDDGSTDKTLEICKSFQNKLPIDIIQHPINLGLGAALKTGFNRIFTQMNANDFLVTMDADGTHPFELIKLMKSKADNGFNLVIASRYSSGGQQNGLNIFRRSLSRCASHLLRFFKPIANVKDYSSGFRLFSYDLVKQMFDKYGDRIITETGFAATLEILLKSANCGINAAEVPLVLEYGNKIGKSKMKVFKTIYRYFFLIINTVFDN